MKIKLPGLDTFVVDKDNLTAYLDYNFYTITKYCRVDHDSKFQKSLIYYKNMGGKTAK